MKAFLSGTLVAAVLSIGITTGNGLSAVADDEPPDTASSTRDEVHRIRSEIAEDRHLQRVSRDRDRAERKVKKLKRKVDELRVELQPELEYKSSVEAEASVTASSGSVRDIARRLMAARGWADQWSCLNSLVMRESGWNVNATNPSSGAYGIPQALPAHKMASAGSDWRTNPATQLRWMMGYIANRYGTPCGAWSHSQATGWY